jgi:hypothetical protein
MQQCQLFKRLRAQELYLVKHARVFFRPSLKQLRYALAVSLSLRAEEPEVVLLRLLLISRRLLDLHCPVKVFFALEICYIRNHSLRRLDLQIHVSENLHWEEALASLFPEQSTSRND